MIACRAAIAGCTGKNVITLSSAAGAVAMMLVPIKTRATIIETNRPAPPNRAFKAWFVAANAAPISTAIPVKANQPLRSRSTIFTRRAVTRSPCTTPTSAAGSQAFTARASDDLVDPSASAGTARKHDQAGQSAEPEGEHGVERHTRRSEAEPTGVVGDNGLGDDLGQV